MSSLGDQYHIQQVIADLPRSPCTRMLGRVVGRPKNLPSLDIPAGNRLDTLGQRGLEAFQGIAFGQSALDHMAETRQTKEGSLHELLRTSSLQLIEHLNTTSRRMRLVVEAAIPSSRESYVRDTAYYLDNRPRYLAWLARQAKAYPAHFESAVVCPRNTDSRRVGSFTREPLPFEMSNRELTSMRQGTLRGGWTVEHIKARCFDIPALPKNRLDNLIIMPFDLNAWTAKLEQIQKPNLFKAGGRHRRRLMICAEPVNGPRQGYFVYGAATPMGLPQDRLDKRLSMEIGDLAPVRPLLLSSPSMRRTVSLSACARI